MSFNQRASLVRSHSGGVSVNVDRVCLPTVLNHTLHVKSTENFLVCFYHLIFVDDCKTSKRQVKTEMGAQMKSGHAETFKSESFCFCCSANLLFRQGPGVLDPLYAWPANSTATLCSTLHPLWSALVSQRGSCLSLYTMPIMIFPISCLLYSVTAQNCTCRKRQHLFHAYTLKHTCFQHTLSTSFQSREHWSLSFSFWSSTFEAIPWDDRCILRQSEAVSTGNVLKKSEFIFKNRDEL